MRCSVTRYGIHISFVFSCLLPIVLAGCGGAMTQREMMARAIARGAGDDDEDEDDGTIAATIASNAGRTKLFSNKSKSRLRLTPNCAFYRSLRHTHADSHDFLQPSDASIRAA